VPLLRRRDEKVQPVKGKAVPEDVEERIKRGREAMLKDANVRELCERFWRGDQNSYIGSKGLILTQSEITTATVGKPPHRNRNVYNHIQPLVSSKVSAATQRVPSYEVIQSTSDHKDYTAARLAEQVAVYLYDEINIRRATTELVTNALVQREGFIYPYFDPNVGPFVAMDNGDELELVGMGEVRLLILTRSEVMWEPSMRFDDSPWWAYERERLISEVEKIPGFVGGKLSSDVKDNKEMVTETVYLERPCPDYPDGRRLVIANAKVIAPEEDFPLKDHEDRVIDKPPLFRLSYTVDPNGDDRGMVESMIPSQRTVNDCTNKLLEWKNRCLNPQMIAPRGSNMDRPDDTPGRINYYNPIGGQKPEWERPPVVPRELFEMREMALQDMRVFAADVDVQPVADLAARTANAAIEQANLRWQSFLGDLAEVHSRVMRACLTLVSRHYTDERMIEIRGDYGWESIADFKGQNLYGQVNTRVRPDSLEAKGRSRMLEELQFMNEAYPGAIPPEAAWTAIQGGDGEGLLGSYAKDIAAAKRLVDTLRQGAETVLGLPPRYDSQMGMEVPGWMPRKQFNTVIFKQVVGDAIKSPIFEDFDQPTQEVFELVWDGLEWLEQARAMQAQMQELGAAAEQGLAQAAKPQAAPQLPQARPMTREQADPARTSV
jgi:hypothetical protein